MLVVMTVRTVLKVPFEKAAPLPFRRPGTPGVKSKMERVPEKHKW